MPRLFLIALRNLLTRKLRNLILGFVIFLTVLILVWSNGLSRGIEVTLFRSATTLATGHVNIAGIYKITNSVAAPVLSDYKELKQLAVDNVPELDYVIDRARGFGKIISEHSSIFSSLNGINVAEESGFADVLSLREGSDLSKLGVPLGDADGPAGPYPALIFEGQAERLQVGIGDQLTVSSPTFRGVNNTVPIRVVAIAKDIGFLSTFFIFVPTRTIRDLYQMSGEATGSIMLYLKDRRDVPKVASRLRSLIEERGYEMMPRDTEEFWRKLDSARREDWTGQKIEVRTWEDDISFLSWTVTAVDGLKWFVTIVLMVVIIVGMILILLMAVRDRTGEIGTLRAIGMPRWKVMTMVVLEAFILSAFFTTLGALVGWGTAEALNAAEVAVNNTAVEAFLMRDTFYLDIHGGTVAAALFVITFFSTLGALPPAVRAALLPPVTAIQRLD